MSESSSSQKVSKSQKNVKSFRVQGSSSQKVTVMKPEGQTSSSTRVPNGLMKSSGESVKSKVQSEGKKSERNVSVLNAAGEDVTPLGLAASYRSAKGSDASSSAVDVTAQSAKETVTDLLKHLELMGGAAIEGGAAAKSIAFTGSKLSQSGADHESINDSDRESQSGSVYEGDDRTAENSYQQLSAIKHTNVSKGLSEIQKTKEADPTKYVSIDLKETDTLFFLTIPSTSVSTEFAEESTFIKAQNAKYKELKSIIVNNDNYVSRSMQAIQTPVKSKEVQATGNKYVDAEVNVSQWAIYDAFTQSEPIENQDQTEGKKEFLEFDIKLSTEAASQSHISLAGNSNTGDPQTDSFNRNESESMMEITLEVPNSIDGSRTSISTNGQHPKKDASTSHKEDPLASIKVESLLEKLVLMERAIVGNNYSKKVLSYRNVPDCGLNEQKRVQSVIQQALENDDQEEAQNDFEDREYQKEVDASTFVPTLRFLWSYKCELTRGRTVSDMSWNKLKEDILAVAYTESKNNIHAASGLILVWSAKNPEWPDRIYQTSSPVSSVDFSKSNPGLLAAGLMDGRVIIYDVRRNDASKILNAGESSGKHRDPVWELRWVERERVVGDDQSRGETLISVSTDGRVTEWIIRKGLEFTDLMVLKRLSKHNQSGSKTVSTTSNSFIARQTGGLCFDFNFKDSNMYLVGTEDGQIHKCSSSYNEQYLNTYSAHTGPVNRVKWSPFLSNVFLSCSADWTVRLWNQDNENEVFKFQIGKDTVNDIAWSPHSSTCFGTVSSSGKLEIWDLKYSVLDPAINHSVLDRQLTSISFASQSPVVITGDDFGTVSVYKICKNSGQRNEYEETDDGVMSEYLKLPISDEAYVQWKQDEAKGLSEVLASKAVGANVAAVPNSA